MSDEAGRVAFDPGAPGPERFDAQAELASRHRPLASDLIPPADVMALYREIEARHQEAALAKSARVIPFPGTGRAEPARRGPQSVLLDHLQVLAYGDYFERPAALSFEALRQIVEQTPVLAAVVLTRVRQVQRFCHPQEQSRGPGFVVRHRDLKHQITPDEQRVIDELARFLAHCGWERDTQQRQRLKRDPFGAFLAKLTRDSLVLDAAAIETERRRDGKGIDGLYAVDGATIRLCTEQGYHGDDAVFAVQVVQGRVCTAYTHQDLVYVPRNVRSDVRVGGYGQSETELLIRVVTGFLNALTLNIKGFDDNSIPRGILHLVGNYSGDDRDNFRRYWNSMVRGVSNAWALPVLESTDPQSKASFERLGVEYNEMYFSKWMTFLTSIICAVYGMSPDEINFESFSAGRSSLSGSDTVEKLADSKDKGLRPLLAYFEGLLTDHVLAGAHVEASDRYVFRWAGLEEEDDARRDERARLVLTVNELRAEEGYDRLDGPLGDAPVNPSLLGPWMQMQQGAQGRAGATGGDFGQGAGEGGSGGGQEEGGRDFGKAFRPPAPGLSVYRIEP
jgi:hypothetical protein